MNIQEKLKEVESKRLKISELKSEVENEEKLLNSQILAVLKEKSVSGLIRYGSSEVKFDENSLKFVDGESVFIHILNSEVLSLYKGFDSFKSLVDSLLDNK